MKTGPRGRENDSLCPVTSGREARGNDEEEMRRGNYKGIRDNKGVCGGRGRERGRMGKRGGGDKPQRRDRNWLHGIR